MDDRNRQRAECLEILYEISRRLDWLSGEVSSMKISVGEIARGNRDRERASIRAAVRRPGFVRGSIGPSSGGTDGKQRNRDRDDDNDDDDRSW